MVAYDPGETLTLVNRATGKSCSFVETKDSYLIVNSKSEEYVTFKEVETEKLMSLMSLQNFMIHSPSLKMPSMINDDFNKIYNFVYENNYPKKIVDESYKPHKDYFIHIVTYKK